MITQIMRARTNSTFSLTWGTSNNGLPSPAADYVEGRIDLNIVCHCTDPSVQLVTAERSHGMNIVSGARLIVDSSIRPAHGNILLAQINGEIDVGR